MQIYCCICEKLLTHHQSEVVAAECGHLFHNSCLLKKLDDACSKCGITITENGIRQIYFNANDHVDMDIGNQSLLNKVRQLSCNVDTLNGKVTQLEQGNRITKYHECEDCLAHKADVEVVEASNNQMQNCVKSVEFFYKMKYDYEILKIKMEEQEVTKTEECEEMKKALDKVNCLVKGSVEGTSDITSKTEVAPLAAIRQLCLIVGTLKQRIGKIEMENEKLAGEFKRLSKDFLDQAKCKFDILQTNQGKNAKSKPDKVPTNQGKKTKSKMDKVPTDQGKKAKSSKEKIIRWEGKMTDLEKSVHEILLNPESELNNPDNNIINLFANTWNKSGYLIIFRVKMTVRMQKLKTSYSTRMKVPIDSITFLYGGMEIKDKETPEQLGMKNKDAIWVIKKV